MVKQMYLGRDVVKFAEYASDIGNLPVGEVRIVQVADRFGTVPMVQSAT
jgi:hypothetical protein